MSTLLERTKGQLEAPIPARRLDYLRALHILHKDESELAQRRVITARLALLEAVAHVAFGKLAAKAKASR